MRQRSSLALRRGRSFGLSLRCAARSSRALLRVAALMVMCCAAQIPKKGIAEYGQCQARLAPLLESSELIKVEYELPFGLSAEEQDGRAVVMKAGKGGEQPGDLLRFFSAWKNTPTGTVAQPDMVDVNKMMNRFLPNGMVVPLSDGWEKVVAALCTNDGAYSTSMVMLFERPTTPPAE